MNRYMIDICIHIHTYVRTYIHMSYVCAVSRILDDVLLSSPTHSRVLEWFLRCFERLDVT